MGQYTKWVMMNAGPVYMVGQDEWWASVKKHLFSKTLLSIENADAYEDVVVPPHHHGRN